MRHVLEQMFINQAIFILKDDPVTFYGTGFFDMKGVQKVNDAYATSLEELRKYALGLVDAFEFSD